jgi:hypothetical protein
VQNLDSVTTLKNICSHGKMDVRKTGSKEINCPEGATGCFL